MARSKWVHVICDNCWYRQHPGKQPVRRAVEEAVRCCFCAGQHLTSSGIFVRWDPAALSCQGNHDV